MTRRLRFARPLTSLVAFAACVTACQTSKSGAGAETPPAPAGAPSPRAGTATNDADGTGSGGAEVSPAEATREAESGLDVGMKFAAFEITNVDSEETYCQVCRFKTTPKVMLVGTVDDAEFHEDLADVEAVLARHRPFGASRDDDPVKAFAVIAEAGDDGLAVPTTDREALIAEAAALRRRLRLHMPVVVPDVEAEPALPGGVFEGHYRITRSRTIMVADADDVVTYSQVAPSNLAAFDAVIGPLMRPSIP